MSEKIQINVTTDKIENQCFVIMPFDGLFKVHYENVIRPAIESTGLECVRGDEVFSRPQVMADLWHSIRQCRLVVAELTGKNPNVFYELGLAHAIGKPSIIVTRNESDVPFDLKAHRYIFYDTNDPFWGDNLQKSISRLISKVLSEKQFGSGLADIELASDNSLPQKPDKPVGLSTARPLFNIKGIWKTSWSHQTTREETVQNHVVFSLQQEDSTITGDCTLSVPFKDDVSVIIENIIGKIEGRKVTLQGVSYTFIKQGKTEDFVLDSFELEVVDANTLRGSVVPNRKRTYIPITLERISP